MCTAGAAEDSLFVFHKNSLQLIVRMLRGVRSRVRVTETGGSRGVRVTRVCGARTTDALALVVASKLL